MSFVVHNGVEKVSKSVKNWVHLLTGAGIAGFFSYLFVMDTDAKQLMSALRQFSLMDLGIALLLLVASHAMRVLRWSQLLRPVNPGASMGICLIPYGSSIAVNNLLPFRAGDVYRIVGFSKQLGSSSWQVLGTVLVERILDLLVLVIFAVVGMVDALSNFNGCGFIEEPWFLPIGAIGFTCLVALSLAPSFASVYLQFYPDTTNVSWALHRYVHPLASQIANAIESLSSPSVWLPVIALSVLAWLMSGMVFSIATASQLQSTSFWVPWFSMAVGNLGSLLPGAPGAVGTFHYFAALGLLCYGVNWSTAVAAVVVVHAFQWVSTTSFGLACLSFDALNNSKTYPNRIL